MQCRGIGPHLTGRSKSPGISRVAAGTWGKSWSLGGDGPSKLAFIKRHQDSCPVVRETSAFPSRLGGAIGMPLEVSRETLGPFPIATGILGFISIFKRSQVLSPLEALNNTCLFSCQKDVRPPVEMRQGTTSFSRVSTGESGIPSSCEMKDEPPFKSLRGNPALFWVRASQFPFQLRQQTLGPSCIPIAERSLLLRCLWKVGIPLVSKPGNQLSSGDDLGYTEICSSVFA